MTTLSERLERLGLSQYLEIFTAEGFDTWETVLDVTESDLTALNVKLGHRRKLQRAIADSRGQPPERALQPESSKTLTGDGAYRSDDSGGETKESSGGRATPAAPLNSAATGGTKRKYRRHPKPDESAPERPPSAYVIFSNQVREELRGQDLSFTEIAKLVGERWQVLSPEIRDTCERQASTAKEKYYNELSEYKKTPQYAQYQQYLADFKTKHATPRPDGKRSRLETDTPPEVHQPARSGSHDRPHRSSSMQEPTPHGHSRNLSNPHTRSGTYGPLGGYRVPSESTSPATYSAGLRSPTTHHTFSPRSSPPDSASVYGSYDLPHHARGASLAPEARSGDPPTPGYFSTVSTTSSMTADFHSRRSARGESSIPALIHTDTTHSSHGEITPNLPYQGSALLPPLDAQKSDRTLPQPIPSVHSLVTSSLHARAKLPQPNSFLPQSHNQEFEDGSQWPALLRATALARDADLQQDDDLPRERGPP
jgi:hypothetical protein